MSTPDSTPTVVLVLGAFVDASSWTGVIAELKAAFNPKLDPYYSDKIDIPPYTTFTMDQLIDCKGP